MTQKENHYSLLNSEAYTASGLIGSGLTMLRKMDFSRETYFSQSLFSLSIGLERLMKLIIIYDYRYSNEGNFPSNEYLKHQIGHNLTKLYSNIKCIAARFEKDRLFNEVDADPICTKILSILTDFAMNSRYYNLDQLSQAKSVGKNPINEWEEFVNDHIVKRHFKISSNTIEKPTVTNPNNAKSNEERMQIVTINNLQNSFYHGQFIEVKAKYSMFYMYKIIRAICSVTNFPEFYIFPILSDHFAIFMNEDDRYVLSKKAWDNYRP